MIKILALLLLLAMGALSYLIFRRGLRQDAPESKNCGKGCTGCGGAAFCSDVKRLSQLAEKQSAKNVKDSGRT